MADDGVGRAVAVELADAWADDHGHSQRRDSADRVDHSRSGKVAIAFSESEVGAQLREPAAAPGPVAIERIGEGAHQHRGDREGQELPAFGACAGNDGQRRIHEHHLEQEDDHDAYVIGAVPRGTCRTRRRCPNGCRTR